MKKSPLASPTLLKDSVMLAFAILAGIEAVLAISAISFECIGSWWVRLLLIVAVYVVITLVTLFVKYRLAKNGIKLNIRGMNVVVKEGDLFEANGWKLIPFNEYFDTTVDDIIIAHNSLNGIFIDKHVDDLENFKRELVADDSSPFANQKSFDANSRWRYPLGTMKRYGEFMLLALTRFNEQNEGRTSRAEYEQTLRRMWSEVGRVYAGKPINIPLVGGGLTRFDDMTEKPNEQLLRCIICTLRTSNVTLTQPVNILLTKEALQTINLYELKGVK